MALEIVELPTLPVAYLRHVGPFDQIGPVFGDLGQRTWTVFAAAAPVDPAEVAAAMAAGPGPVSEFGPRSVIAVYLDDPSQVAPADLRSDACVVLPPSVDAAALAGTGVSVREIRGGRFAVLRYVGPYSGLGQAWGRLMAESEAAGLRFDITRECFEAYRNMPGMVPDAELVTDVYEPVC